MHVCSCALSKAFRMQPFRRLWSNINSLDPKLNDHFLACRTRIGSVFRWSTDAGQQMFLVVKKKGNLENLYAQDAYFVYCPSKTVNYKLLYNISCINYMYEYVRKDVRKWTQWCDTQLHSMMRDPSINNKMPIVPHSPSLYTMLFPIGFIVSLNGY